MKTHHLYSTAMILAAAAMISAQPLSAQTISGTQTKAVNMTEGKLTVTGTGFLNVEKNAVNLNKEIQSLLEIEILEGGRISGKRALALDPDMEKGVTGELIRLNNAGTMTGTENQAIDLSHMINTSATITNTGAISASQKGAVKLGNNATLINSGLIETTAAGENGIPAKNYNPEDDGISTFAHGLQLINSGDGRIIGMKHGVTGEGEAAVTNSALIEGKGGSGLNWDWDPTLQQNDKYIVTVINEENGMIRGTGNTTALDGDGVDVDYAVNLTNRGQIIAKDSFGSADGLAIGGGSVTNSGTISASNSNAAGQAYGILVDDSDGGNAFESVAILNSGTIQGEGSNGVGIKIVSDQANSITMAGGLIHGGSGTAVIMGSGNDTFTYMAGTVSGGIDGGSGNNAMIFQSAAGQSTTFNADLKNFNSIRVESGDIVLSGLTITMELASLSQDSPLFTLSGSTSRETGPSLSFQDVTLQLLGTGNVNTDSDDGGMVYFQLASDGISLDGLDIRTEQGYQLDLSRDGFIGINFNTPEPTAAVLGIFGFSLVLLRRRRKAA